MGGDGINECCANCKLHFPLVRFDYSKGGCRHTDMDGFICMAFATPAMGEPPIAIWMTGNDPERDMCECFIPRGDCEWPKNANQ